MKKIIFLLLITSCLNAQAQIFTIKKESKLSYTNKYGNEDLETIDITIQSIKPQLAFSYKTNSYDNSASQIKISASLLDTAYCFASKIEDIKQEKEGDVFGSSNLIVSKKVYAAIIATYKYVEPDIFMKDKSDDENSNTATPQMVYFAKPIGYKCTINGKRTTVQAIALEFKTVLNETKLQQTIIILKNKAAPILLRAYTKIGSDTIYNFKLTKVII